MAGGSRIFGIGWRRQNLASPSGSGCENAVVPHKVEPGRRHQSRELPDEFERFKDDVGRSVAPAALEAIQQAAIRQQGETLLGQRRTRDITAELLEPQAVASGDADFGMQTDAPRGGKKGSGARLLFQVLHLYAILYGADLPAGPRPGGDPAGHRDPVKLGEQGLIAGEAVGFLRVGLRSQSEALEQPGDPAGDASGDPSHIGRSGRSQRLEVRELPKRLRPLYCRIRGNAPHPLRAYLIPPTEGPKVPPCL